MALPAGAINNGGVPPANNPQNNVSQVKNGYFVKNWGDGSRYEGEWVDDMMTGRGFMIWADGRRYDGEWLENRCNGRGVLTYKNGRRYEGEYKLDKMHGRGVYIWAEGARYEGEYKEDKKNGRGVQTWPSGARYEGEYLDSMQTGYGLMTWADGRRYEGYWVNSKCTGFGILTHKDGRRYEGEYVNDKMQGHGVYTWANGAKYDGDYKDNKKNGHGLHTWPDGSMYEGEYLDGMQTGQGYMAWGDGRVYRGAWVQSKCTGYGVLTHADGRRYEGYYLKDKMHGHGIYTWADGRRYNGEYKNNLKHGSGLWTWPDGVMLEGQWAENLPCRHACTIIFSSFVSTTEVQPRLGLDHDTTLQKLWEDAHAWRLEHNVVHSPAQSAARFKSPAHSSLHAPPPPFPAAGGAEFYSDGEEVAPSGAAGGGMVKGAGAAGTGPRRGKSPPPGGVGEGGAATRGANGASVDVGRPAEQSTEMFRSLRSVAVQLEQGLAEMEDVDGVLDEHGEGGAEEGPSTAGPSNLEEGPMADSTPGGVGAATAPGGTYSACQRARLQSIREKLVQQVQLLHIELDRHGGAERLVASTSRGAGSEDAGDSLPLSAGMQLRERRMGEFSVDEVCEQLASLGLGQYEATFRARDVDGARMMEVDDSELGSLGVEQRIHRSTILRMRDELA